MTDFSSSGSEDKTASRILLVEDEIIIAMNEARILEQEGYSVVTVNDAEAAISEIGKNHFDLVLMDIDLGEGLDGTEAAKEILRDHSVPIVFLSSHTEPEIVRKTEGITSYGYILKNSGITVLSASIKMAFKLYNANKKLQEQKEELDWEKNRLDKYINVAGAMLVALDKDYRITLINQKGCRILGYAENELIGRNWLENFILPENQEGIEAVFSDILVDDENFPEYNENWIICKDNRKKLIAWHNSVLRDQDNKITGLLCSGEDITELMEYEESLERSRNDFYQLFYGMNEGAAIYKPIDGGKDFLIIDMNEEGQKIAGVKLESIINKSITEVFPGLEDIGLLEKFRKVLVSNKAEFLSLRHYRDERVDILVENHILKLPSGNIVAFYRERPDIVEYENKKTG